MTVPFFPSRWMTDWRWYAIDDFPIFVFFRKEWTVEEVLREARRVDSANIIQRVKVYNFRLNGRFFKNFKAKLEQRRKNIYF